MPESSSVPDGPVSSERASGEVPVEALKEMRKAAFAREFSRLRNERGMPMRELAGKMGYTASYISHIESGKFPPTVQIASRGDAVLRSGRTLTDLQRLYHEACVSANRSPRYGTAPPTPPVSAPAGPDVLDGPTGAQALGNGSRAPEPGAVTRRFAVVVSAVSPVHHEPSAEACPLKHKYRHDRVELYTELAAHEGWLAVRTPADPPGFKWMPARDLRAL